ncbi:MAG: hypothetical protein IPP51_17570 [Bacteroidetes bacterium]|nr:hypothetical protein [Bacteroidota bacterium]
MRGKYLNLLLVITSLFGYLEWGGGRSMFLFRAEFEILSKLFTDTSSVLHPFTIMPMLGQVLLLITLFQKQPNKTLTYSGIVLLGILLLFMFIIGILSKNPRIIISTIPFLTLSVLTIIHFRKIKIL